MPLRVQIIIPNYLIYFDLVTKDKLQAQSPGQRLLISFLPKIRTFWSWEDPLRNRSQTSHFTDGESVAQSNKACSRLHNQRQLMLCSPTAFGSEVLGRGEWKLSAPPPHPPQRHRKWRWYPSRVGFASSRKFSILSFVNQSTG